MKRAPKFEAVLVSCGSITVTADGLTPLIVEVLREHGEIVPGRPIRSDDGKTITGRTVWVQVRALPAMREAQETFDRMSALDRQARINESRHMKAARARGRLSITVGWHGPAGTDPGQRPAGILADLIHEAVMQAPIDYVAWLSKEVLLTPEEFLSACHAPAPVSPSATRAARNLADEMLSRPVDDPLTDRLMEQLPGRGFGDARQGFQTPDGDIPEAEVLPSQPLRLASWAMTGTVATLSLPVAAAVAVISLGKGEDFRLNTQALSVTGLFAALNAAGVPLPLI